MNDRAILEQATSSAVLSQGSLGPAGCGLFEAPRIGPLWLAWVGEGLTVLTFGAVPPPEPYVRRFVPELWPIPEASIPPLIADALSAYFAGEPIDPATLPVRLGGTAFQRRTWGALRTVRRGAVRSYAGLAADVGSPRAMRAVGMAMAHNPLAIVVPCHRVVTTGHNLGGFSGGLERKRILLELEGAKVEGDVVRPGQLPLL